VGEEVDEGGCVQGHRVGGAGDAGPEHQLSLGGEPDIARLRRPARQGAPPVDQAARPINALNLAPC
jgi:hypothetical protein